MKKSILALAVAASLAVPAAANAEAKVYGNIHLTIQAVNSDAASGSNTNNNVDLSSNTSSIGVKGSEDLGNGLKAIYKAEYQIDAADNQGGGNALTQRDIFVGVKGAYGTAKFGIMSSNWKQTGAKVDPFYRTPVEGRGFLDIQSKLHSGRDINRGRSTNTVQYVSPKFSGIFLVANTTLSANNDETTGVGLRWSNKHFLAYGDYINAQTGKKDLNSVTGIRDIANLNKSVTDCGKTPGTTDCSTESAYKVGGKFHNKMFSVGLQYESAQNLTNKNYIFASGTYHINRTNILALTYGKASVDIEDATHKDHTGGALGYVHVLSKMTVVYAAYGKKSADVNNTDISAWALGIRKKF